MFVADKAGPSNLLNSAPWTDEAGERAVAVNGEPTARVGVARDRGVLVPPPSCAHGAIARFLRRGDEYPIRLPGKRRGVVQPRSAGLSPAPAWAAILRTGSGTAG
jgi:hypothetical protein